MKQLNTAKIEISDGGRYSAYAQLFHPVTPDTGVSAIAFSVKVYDAPGTVPAGTFKTYPKRGIKGIDGKIRLFISDVLQEIKRNVYQFLPVNSLDNAFFYPVTISYTNGALPAETLQILVANCLVSTLILEQTTDFLTQRGIIEMPTGGQFEQGLNFFGAANLEFDTDTGPVPVTLGSTDTMSFLSLRELDFPVGGSVPKVQQLGAEVALSSQVIGFENGELESSFLVVYGSTASIPLPVNDEGNVLTLGAGVLTGIVTANLSIDFGTGYGFGVCSKTGRIFNIATGYVGSGFADSGPYLFHKYGGIRIATGKFLSNLVGGVSQIEII